MLVFVAGLGGSCQKAAQPQEVAAMVLGPDYSMCGGCGGTFIRVDTTVYRADINGYNTNTPVWVRYRKRTDVVLNWIDILSIRKR